ncbi:hypothetical protein ACX9H9_001624 [Campylobacter jejuni]
MEKNTINNENIQKNEILIPKRVLFDEKTLKMIEMMIPAYKDEISNVAKENEKINQMIKLAIEKMFKNDFLNKINRFFMNNVLLHRITEKGNIRYYSIEIIATLFEEYMVERIYGNVRFKSWTGIKNNVFPSFNEAQFFLRS